MDYDRIIVPWVGFMATYIVWTAGHHLVLGALGEDWPLGREGLDLFPEEQRYSQTSPLGINGSGMSLSLWVLLPAAALFPVALGVDAAVLAWRVRREQRHLAASRLRARVQRSQLVRTVFDSVPPFA